MVTIVTVLAVLAAWFDLRKNIIPNRVVFPGIGIGILVRTASGILCGEPLDILVMTAEVIVLFICLWPVYTAGGLGAGDCKLFLMAGVFLPVKQAVFVVTFTFFIAAVQIVLFVLFCKVKKEKKKIRTIPLAPAFLIAVLSGWL
ncbi:MAG: prepilin peptidase [Lachnospiraceae bacterium]|nr:prepilin peptidase [Lachnospiraceae bacterium]